MDTKTETLYNGSELTAETFSDFVERLRFHSRGAGVDDHCTADAIFIVQRKKFVTGLDTDFADDKCIYDNENCESYYSLESFIADLHPESLEYYELDDFGDGISFFDMSKNDQWDAIENVAQLTVSGYREEWEYVNSHLTKEAAERFIERKKHDYRDGLRVYVDAQVYCWEFNAIKEALMDGKIVFKPDELKAPKVEKPE